MTAQDTGGVVGRLRERIEFAHGCWAAAEAEGLYERISDEGDDGPASLQGLFARRLNWIPGALRDAGALLDTLEPKSDSRLAAEARIVLASVTFGIEGFDLHGLFHSFDDALAHVIKDEGKPVLCWDSDLPVRRLLCGATQWTASVEPIRAALTQPASDAGEMRFEDSPIGKAIIDLRHRGACDMTDPQHGGQRGQDWDNGLIAAYRAAEAAALSHPNAGGEA